jgi:hypothetical protein
MVVAAELYGSESSKRMDQTLYATHAATRLHLFGVHLTSGYKENKNKK